jgi:hypothetical protein
MSHRGIRVFKRFIVVLFLATPLVSLCQDKVIPVVVDGNEISYLQEGSKVIAKGDVKMKYREIELYCQEADYDVKTNVAHVKGDVKIIRGDTTLYGEDVVYDFNTHNAHINDIRVEDYPIYGEAKSAEKEGQEKYRMRDSYVTTCDLKEPHYRLVAKQITVYPGEKVVAKNMTLMVGKVPVFYIPFFSQSLKEKSFPVELIPGKNSEWGYYVLTRWRYNLSESQQGKVVLDWYEKRGQGLGVIHQMESKNFGKALVRYHRVEDELYHADSREDLFEEYPQRKRIDGKFLEDDRYKAQASYGWQPRPNVSVIGEFHKFSDEFYMKDFFEEEYEVEPHPLSYALIDYSFVRSALSLLAQKRANIFFEEAEYLPQLEYNFFRQNIGSSKFYLELNDRVGNLNYKFARSPVENTAFRFYGKNTLSYADRLGWLRINPYAGAYTAFYSRNRFGDNRDIFRVAPEMGTTLSTNLYKYFDIHWSMFGETISQMRHILTPQVRYLYRHDPTVANANIYIFDEHDTLARREAVIFALKNKLQVKTEEGRTRDFVYFRPSVEYRIHEEGTGSYFDNIKADLEIYPRKGISLNAESIYDVPIRDFTEFNADITFKGGEGDLYSDEEGEGYRYSVSAGHRYLKDDSTQGTLGFTCQLSPKWQFRNYLRYEYTTGDFQEQQYALRRDLHCWWMDVGVDIDRHEEGGKDITFWVIFRLKAFPDIHVDFDHTYSGAKSTY